MRTRLVLTATVLFLFLCSLVWVSARQIQMRSHRQEFQVAGQTRTALVYANARQAANAGAPLIIAYHGHGGTSAFSARNFKLHELWPEAIVVYPQGLPTSVPLYDQAGRFPGWQVNPGEQQDRDVQFFDVLLEQLQKQYRIDPKRIYVMGHSNGARFVNVLWQTRGTKIAAFVGASAQGGLMIRDAVPRPYFALIGENDHLVPAQGQLKSLEIVRKVLQTDRRQTRTDGFLKIEPGKQGTELVTYIHPGEHKIPVEAYPLFIQFFQRHQLR